MSNIVLPLRYLNFATFLQYQRFVMPISFLFYLHNGLTFSDFILFQSVFNITCLAAKIPLGFLGDVFNKKSLLIFSYFLFMLRVILWIFFSGFWIVLAGEVLYGLFKALYRGNVDSDIYEWLKQNNVEEKMLPRYGRLSFYTSLGSAVSCIAGAVLYKYYGFRIILCIELIMQIIAVSLLFFIPNLSKARERKPVKSYLNDIKESIMSTITNENVKSFVYCSAILTGLTGVFVWNFQPILKACSAPILMFGVISFINQLFRGVGGLTANKIALKIDSGLLFKVEFFAVVVSFIAIIFAYSISSYKLNSLLIILVCIAILLFVVFNVYTVSKIHENTKSYTRATTSSTNTFFGDFASFAFLFLFKITYDACGINTSLLIFLCISIALLLPCIRKVKLM